MKVLVTGATGFVGGWLTKRLVSEGYDVAILRRETSDVSEINDLKIEHCIGDVTDVESIKRAAKDCDVVFHLAGLVAYTPSERPMMDKINIGGTKNVIDACIAQKVGRLVHMSSVVAIGASFDGKPLNEESEFNVGHLNLGYFETKHAAEKLIVAATKAGTLDAVMVNPSTIYGAGDAKKGSRKVQLKVARGQFNMFPPGGVNVVAVEDVIEGLLRAWKSGKKGERYILAGENMSLKELFTIIAEYGGVPAPEKKLSKNLIKILGFIGNLMEKFGKKGPMNRETAWTSVLYHWFENDKAIRELGMEFRPSREAIKNSVDWIKQHPEIG